MGRSRYQFRYPDQPHFMTLTVLQWLPIFTRPATVEIVFSSLRHLKNDGFNLYAYVILENHLHLIAQSGQIDKDIARFKSFTARQLIEYLRTHRVDTLLKQLALYKTPHKRDRQYQFWQEGVHPELISSDTVMRQKIEYIHNNPVQRGYVDSPEHWRYSSARDYAGGEGQLKIERWV
jgi:REP element-mobilizing transposase RayT